MSYSVDQWFRLLRPDPNSPLAALTDKLQRQAGGPHAQWKRMGEDAKATWQGAVTGNVLGGMTNALTSRRYHDAIGDPSLQTDGLRTLIHIPLDSAEAQKIQSLQEHGHGGIDMRAKLLAKATRTNKAGEKYIVVPITQTTGTDKSEGQVPTIPQQFHNLISKRVRPRAAQPKFKPKLPGEKVPYGPGRKHMTFGRTVSQAGYRQQYGHLSGLRGSAKAGLNTFRTVSEKSEANAWQIPPRPANPIREAVVDDVVRRWSR